jgi:protein-S-isoprenylcysteine O-methyltransferase Ste14
MTALKALFFLILAPGLLGFYIPLRFLTAGPKIDTGILSVLAFPAWATGALIILWSFIEFLVRGKGTPAPIDPPKQLVVTGPYAHVRNPMYVSMLLVLGGHFLWFEHVALLALAMLAFAASQLFVRLYEEPTLKRLFGAEYAEYRKSVPRWIPKWNRK